MPAIFLSYRREDTEGETGRLCRDLTAEFGSDKVFIDVSGIEPGRDFRKVIEKSVASCGVVLAVIGRNWIDVKDEAGRRRLDDPLDFVRLETAAALRRDIPVIPVLVHGGRMPQAEQLPEDLRDLAYRNGVELTHVRWDSDIQILIKALRPHVAPQDAVVAMPVPAPPTRTSPPMKISWSKGLVAAVSAIVLAALLIGGYMYIRIEQTTAKRAADEAAAARPADQKSAAGEAVKPATEYQNSAPNAGETNPPPRGATKKRQDALAPRYAQ